MSYRHAVMREGHLRDVRASSSLLHRETTVFTPQNHHLPLILQKINSRNGKNNKKG